MAPPVVTSVMITGANIGVGKECARQLALKDGMTKVILACRNADKAEAAKEDLEESTGKLDNGFFEILIMDVSNLDSVRKAVDEIKEPIDGLIMNAGGGGGPDPAAMTEDGVPAIVAANLLGHVLLVDLLVEQKKLKGSAVYVGSEASRGAKEFGMKAPVLENGSVEEFVSILDSSFYTDPKGFDNMYPYTKLVGTLWTSSMARKVPSIRFVTVSPGATAGTNVTADLPTLKRWMYAVVMPVMEMIGKMHSVEAGAERYVDVLMDEEGMYTTGNFYASKEGLTGEMVDQVKFTDTFKNETYQDNANTAIHKFIK